MKTPTAEFSRDQVLRVPDIMSDSLTVSYTFMRKVCDILRDSGHELAPECLPYGYVPSL